MFSVMLFVAAQAVASTPAVEEPDPKAMSRAEINAFNAKVERAHPFYIRCERQAEIGSLVKRTYSCRTNAQWRAADETGNDKAREMGDAFKPKFLAQSGG